MNSKRNVKILGTGRYIPKNKITSEEIDKRLNLPEGSVEKISGVKERFFVNSESATEMGYHAAMEALEIAGLSPTDLDCIVSTCGVNEQPIPTSSCLISEKLGLQNRHTPCVDVNSSCMSFLAGLDTVSYQIDAGRYQNVLLVSSDITSEGVNWSDVKSSSLFGDGASAVVAGRDNSNESFIIMANTETYSRGAHLSEIKGGGNKLHPLNFCKENAQQFMYKLQGPDMLKLVFEEMEDFFKRTKEKFDLWIHDMIKDSKVVIPHQVSPKFVSILQKALNIPDEKMINLVRYFGNMLSVSLPLGLDEAIKSGRLKRGDRFLIFGGGSGISLGMLYAKY